ncbi:MAG: UDP-N-acetylmuramoyl-tripeptide--D-alanyl-D-alanine ligase [Bacteroidales bacterium]|nr:UDP-N-acetylmuramoyl-tripeptide--D-alanyl-D-alanine ligase [Bacteroidales bacterium]MDD4384360.1 UDP-N-acetylmuramoyl-tripeptide--D-alanyl-D-alanine ligase [Bacteroidales bacterium]MDY0198238.1 UDP-N-acetylmuramoyl-tripeptide--D-alanyl-D-alanine ligase [Tenuifilaceae bacterium]
MEALAKVHSLILQGYKPCIDTRKVEGKCIFFALKGENFDGNAFAKDALAKGAYLAICDDPSLKGKLNIEYVPNTLTFLQNLAKFHRQSLNIPIVGLTGSNGKTTTKELLLKILSTQHNTFATQGNLNNHIGVPLSILSITAKHHIAVIEMGANHIGEIETLCSIAQPTHGLITNIGKAHLEGFGSFEGVKKAKSELYQFLAANKGVVFVNDKNQVLNNLIYQYNFSSIVGYNNQTISAKVLPSKNNFLNLEVDINGKKARLSTQMVGEYNIENIIAAISVGQYFGVDIESCLTAIENYVPTNSRSQIIETEHNTIVLDAYNANPSSMELALLNFNAIQHKKSKTVIIGEMLELGGYAKTEHERIYRLAKELFSKVFTVGENYRNISSSKHWFAKASDLKCHLIEEPIVNQFILLKGSRGVKLEELLDVL